MTIVGTEDKRTQDKKMMIGMESGIFATTDKTLMETALLILWTCVPSLVMLLRIVSPFSSNLSDPIF